MKYSTYTNLSVRSNKFICIRSMFDDVRDSWMISRRIRWFLELAGTWSRFTTFIWATDRYVMGKKKAENESQFCLPRLAATVLGYARLWSHLDARTLIANWNKYSPQFDSLRVYCLITGDAKSGFLRVVRASFFAYFFMANFHWRIGNTIGWNVKPDWSYDC